MYAGFLLWLFVPVGQKVKEFLSTIPGYPFQQGGTINQSQMALPAAFIACANIASGLKSGGACRGGKSLNVSACSLRM